MPDGSAVSFSSPVEVCARCEPREKSDGDRFHPPWVILLSFEEWGKTRWTNMEGRAFQAASRDMQSHGRWGGAAGSFAVARLWVFVGREAETVPSGSSYAGLSIGLDSLKVRSNEGMLSMEITSELHFKQGFCSRWWRKGSEVGHCTRDVLRRTCRWEGLWTWDGRGRSLTKATCGRGNC